MDYIEKVLRSNSNQSRTKTQHKYCEQRYPHHNFKKFDAVIQLITKSQKLKENP